MNYENFMVSIKKNVPPKNLSPASLAMWYALKNNWTMAHEIIQSQNDKNSSWIHAYLHRFEGDESNANYWYKKAGISPVDKSLANEAKKIVLCIFNKK